MTRFPIPHPFGGVSDEDAYVEQKPGTTRVGENARGYDPRTKRKRISQRPGSRKYAASQVNGTAKISALIPVSYDNRNQTYSSETLGSEPTVSSTTSPSKPWLVPVIRHDSLGNRYFVDGKSTVVKMNPDNKVVWLLPLPIKQAQTQVRALWIDNDTDVYVATSAGLGQQHCKIFKYRQTKDDKTELVWTVDTNAFVEDLAVRNGRMATIQNDVFDQDAQLVVYDGLFFPAGPIEAWRHKVAFPGNGLAISPKDASIFVASQANPMRGVIPTDPLLSQTSTHWTPEQAPFWNLRAWAWHDGTDVDGDQTFNSAYTDGSPIPLWADKTGNGRHLYQRPGTDAPTLNQRGAAGLDCVRFTDGLSGTNVQALVSGTNVSTDRSGAAQHGTLLPGYVGAGWALFMVVRFEAVATIRQLIIQNLDGSGAFDATAAGAKDVGLFVNTKPNGAAGRAAQSGAVMWNDSNTYVGATLAQPLEQYASHEQVAPFEKTDLCLITLIYDGTPYGGLANPNNCTLRIDGRVAQSWHLNTTKAWTGATEIGNSVNAVAGASSFRGNICEILVLRDYQATVGGARQIIDTTWSSGTAFPSELHLFEGYFGHRWGISHKFPAGAHGAVTFAAAGNATNNDTVTIAGQAYRFRNVLAANYDVLIGANGTATLVNLGHAINNTGTPGFDYFATTPISTTVRALESYQPLGITGATDVGLVLISLDPAATAFTVTSGGATPPTGVAGSSTFRSGDNANYAHQLHPFYYQPTGINTGGPPVDLGINTTSPEGLLTNTGPILAKYEPGRGEVKWTVINPTTVNQGIGGIGYGVAVSLNGYVFSTGPVSSTATNGAVTVDQLRETNAVFRGIKDLGESVVTDHTLNNDSTVPWVVHNGTSDSPPTGPWYSPEYPYPRPDTDKFDNCYMPWSSVYTTYGSVLLLPRGTNVGGSWSRQTYPEFQRCLAVSGDPDIPDYSPDSPNTFEFLDAGTYREAWYVLTSDGVNPVPGDTLTIGTQGYTFINAGVPVGTQILLGVSAAITLQRIKAAINNEAGAGTTYSAALVRNALAGCVAVDTTTLTVRAKDPATVLTVAEVSAHLSWGTQSLKDNTIHRKRFVKTTPFAGSPRAHLLLAVAGTDVKRATGGTILSLGSGSGTGVIDAAAQYVSYAVLDGKAYITDGIRRTPLVVDPKTLLASSLAAQASGQVPPRCKLACSWNKRLVLARSLKDSSGIYLSEKGNAAGWDFKPINPTPRQAYDLQLANSTGNVPDTIQAIYSTSDDLLIVGCLTSMHRITGDPALGGTPQEITTTIGCAFGRSIAKDGKGNIYFASFPEPGVWVMPPGGFDPIDMTGRRLQNDLASIDWASSTLELRWDAQREGLWLIQVPYANPGTALQRWFWERENNAWWPDTDLDPTRAPTCIEMLNADQEAHRGLLFGCADGYIRIVDDDARNDDGKAILSRVLYGPFAPSKVPNEFLFDDLAIVTASDQDGVGYEIYATNDPSSLGQPHVVGVCPRGRGPMQEARAAASYVAVMVKNFATNERFSIEEVSIDASGAGIKRSDPP